jgi:integrase
MHESRLRLPIKEPLRSALARRKKPRKPYRSFPLTAHNNGQWCKKIRGKVHFFGVWDDSQAALNNYLSVAAVLHAGRRPSPISLSAGSITVKDVCNRFLTSQQRRADAGEIEAHWFDACRRTTEDFARFVGTDRVVEDLGPADFEAYRLKLTRRGLTRAKGLGVHAIDRSVTVVKAIFAYANDMEIIKHPVNLGKAFRGPSAASKRKPQSESRIRNGAKLFDPSEVRRMLGAAGTPLRAMVLLGINGGFGSTDCSRLPISAIRPDTGTIEFARPKNGIERVVPLWPETGAALEEAIADRPSPDDESYKDAKGLVFLTAFGQSWVRYHVRRDPNGSIETVTRMDAIRGEFDKLLAKLGLKRRGIGFYTLRHTFRTWADEVHDQHAIHRIMGHAIPGMSGIYVEKIELHRLRAVVDHVRRKLLGEPAPSSSEGPAASPAT